MPAKTFASTVIGYIKVSSNLREVPSVVTVWEISSGASFLGEDTSLSQEVRCPGKRLTRGKRAIYWPGCAGSTPKVSLTVCCWPWRKMVRVTVCPACVLLIK